MRVEAAASMELLEVVAKALATSATDELKNKDSDSMMTEPRMSEEDGIMKQVQVGFEREYERHSDE
jgi:hypothetical protein